MTCLECVLCARQLEAAARGVWGGGQGLELHGRPLTAKKVEISQRKHLMLSSPAPNAPSDTADKKFIIWKHAVGV